MMVTTSRLNNGDLHRAQRPDGRSGALKNFQEQTYEILLDRILSAAPGFAPGSKLDVHALSEEFGISIVPIKESLRILQAEGLVNIHARSGTYVAALDHRGLDDLIDFLRELEIAALRLARKRSHTPDVQQLRSSVLEAKKGLKSSRVGESVTQNLGFHGHLVALSENNRLIHLYGSPRAYLLVTVYRSRDFDVRSLLLAQHTQILEALEREDWALVDTLVTQHWEDTRRYAHIALDELSGKVGDEA